MPAGSSFYCVVVAERERERERGRGFLCWHNIRGACSTHTVLLLPSTIPYHSLVVVLLLCLSFVFGFPPKTSECCNQLLTYEVLVLGRTGKFRTSNLRTSRKSNLEPTKPGFGFSKSNRTFQDRTLNL